LPALLGGHDERSAPGESEGHVKLAEPLPLTDGDECIACGDKNLPGARLVALPGSVLVEHFEFRSMAVCRDCIRAMAAALRAGAPKRARRKADTNGRRLDERLS
jgi:hypothetical protein